MMLLYVIGGIGVGLFFMMRLRWVQWRHAAFWGMAVGLLQALAMINEFPLAWMTYDTAIPRSTFLAQQAATVIASFIGFSAFFGAVVHGRRNADPPRLRPPPAAVAALVAARSTSRRPGARSPGASMPGRSGLTVGRLPAGLGVPRLRRDAVLRRDEVFRMVVARPKRCCIRTCSRPTRRGCRRLPTRSRRDSGRKRCSARCRSPAPRSSATASASARSSSSSRFIVQALIFGAGHAPYPGAAAYARPVELIIPSIGFGLLYLALRPAARHHPPLRVRRGAVLHPHSARRCARHLAPEDDGRRCSSWCRCGSCSSGACRSAAGPSSRRPIATPRGPPPPVVERRARRPSSAPQAAIGPARAARPGWRLGGRRPDRRRSSRWSRPSRRRCRRRRRRTPRPRPGARIAERGVTLEPRWRVMPRAARRQRRPARVRRRDGRRSAAQGAGRQVPARTRLVGPRRHLRGRRRGSRRGMGRAGVGRRRVCAGCQHRVPEDRAGRVARRERGARAIAVRGARRAARPRRGPRAGQGGVRASRRN